MVNHKERIAEISKSALKVLDIIRAITEEYQTADKNESLFDTQELNLVWENLKRLKKEGDLLHLNELIHQAFRHYISPLPIRPLVSQLVSARFRFISCLHEKSAKQDLSCIKIADDLFCESLFYSLELTLKAYEAPTQDFFNSLKRVFFAKMMKSLIENPGFLVARCEAPTPIKVYEKPKIIENHESSTPSLFIDVDESSDDEQKELTSNIYKSLFKGLYHTKITESPSTTVDKRYLFSPAYDSDGESIDELFVGSP